MESKTKRQAKRFPFCRLLPVLLLGALILLAFLSYFNSSFGWFASNLRGTATGMQISTVTDLFELAVSSAQESPYAADSAIVTYLNTNAGYEKRNATDNQHVSILCKLNNENPYNSDNINEIGPGSFGTFSFDIVQKTDTPLDFTINLSFLPLNQDNSGDPEAISAADLLILRPLISGHVLFFQQRTNRSDGSHYYADRIADDTLLFDSSAHSYTDRADGRHYTVTIYWEWPATFGQIALEDGNPKLHRRSLYNDSSEQAELLDFITDHPGNFFRELGTVNFARADFADYYFVELSDGYNLGDQFIGDRTHYLAVLAEVLPVPAAVSP